MYCIKNCALRVVVATVAGRRYNKWHTGRMFGRQAIIKMCSAKKTKTKDQQGYGVDSSARWCSHSRLPLVAYELLFGSVFGYPKVCRQRGASH